MEFRSSQTKSGFLDQLKAITAGGSPNLAATPFSIFRVFNPPNTLPFFGIIRPNGFHVSIVKGIYDSSIALDGEIEETNSGIIIRTKFDTMIFPLLLHFLVIAGSFIMGTVVLWLTGDFRVAMILYCFSGLAFAFAWYLRKIEKEKLVKRFLANTTAVRC